VRVNGTPVESVRTGSYLPIRRRWAAGDTVELSFDMTTRLLKANPAVNEDRGRVAFQRGPVVFCMEQLDQAGGGQASSEPAGREHSSSLVGYTAKLDAATTAKYEPDLLGGVLVLEHPGAIVKGPTETGLYYSAAENVAPAESSATLRLIPYYAWANRAPSPMQVWIPYRFG
jgi:hypothetical protein